MKVETLVFFDVETIGLREGAFINSNYPASIFQTSLNALKEKGPQKAPYIAELAFLAVRVRTYFETASRQMQRILKFQLEEKLDPGNVYVSCNPEIQVRMTPKVYSTVLKPNGISKDRWEGFDDDRLRIKRYMGKVLFSKDELNSWSTLEEEWPRIIDFLNSLPKPLCILAHNGYAHDFPLLAYEFIRNKIAYTGFSSDTYFVDTLRMMDFLECSRFQQAAESLKIDLKQAQEEKKLNVIEAILERFYQLHPKNYVFDALKSFILAQSWSEGGKLRFVEAITYTAYRQAWRAEKRSSVEPQPLKIDIRRQWSRSGVFGLPYLYNKFIGKNQQHRAQADCEALLKVCLVFGQEVIDYVNCGKNKVTWTDLNRDLADSDTGTMVDLHADYEDSLCAPFSPQYEDLDYVRPPESLDLNLADSLKALESSKNLNPERKSSRASDDLFENSQERPQEAFKTLKVDPEEVIYDSRQRPSTSKIEQESQEACQDSQKPTSSTRTTTTPPRKRHISEIVCLDSTEDSPIEVKENFKKAKIEQEVLIFDVDSSEEVQVVENDVKLRQIKESNSQEVGMNFSSFSKTMSWNEYTKKSRVELEKSKNSEKKPTTPKRRTKSAFILK